jgi:hypothetical protein
MALKSYSLRVDRPVLGRSLAYARHAPAIIHGGGNDGSVSPRKVASKLLGKQIDNANDGLLQLRQHWDNKLSLPLRELGERYLRKDLSIVLDCTLGNGEIFGGQRFSLVVRHYFEDGIQVCPGRESNVGATCNDHQLPMLIESVHIVNNANRVVNGGAASLVWLESSDQRKDTRLTNALYFSVIFGLFSFRQRFPKDRELKRVRVLSPSLRAGKVPDEMVKTGAKVVDDFAAQNAKSVRNLSVSMVVHRFLPFLVVWMGENWIFAFFKESEDFSMQITDILVGPF